jgi:hypothetical protein
VASVQELILREFPILAKDETGRYPIDAALSSSQFECVKVLLRAKSMVRLNTSPWLTWAHMKGTPTQDNFAKLYHTATLVGEHSDSPQMVVIGGCDQEQTIGGIFVLDIPTRQWMTFAMNPNLDKWTARIRHTATLVGDCIFVFGGSAEQEGDTFALNDLHIVAINNFAWQKPFVLGQPPAPRSGHSASLIGRKIYIFGGLSQGTFLNDIHTFDTDTYEWSLVVPDPSSGPAPSPRLQHTATVVNDTEIWIYGGCDRVSRIGGQLASFAQDPNWHAFDTVTRKWRTVSGSKAAPQARFGHTATLVDDDIYILGGMHTETTLNELWIFNIKTCTWRQQLLGPTDGRGAGVVGIAFHSTVLFDNHLLVYAGLSSGKIRESLCSLYIGKPSDIALKKLKIRREQNEAADVKFIFPNRGSEYLLGHRVILTCGSRYFRRLFETAIPTYHPNSGVRLRKKLLEISIEDVKPEVFSKILDFIYSGWFDLSDVEELINLKKKKEKKKMFNNNDMEVPTPDFYLELIDAAERYIPEWLNCVVAVLMQTRWPLRFDEFDLQETNFAVTLDDSTFSDVKLLCEDKVIYAHKVFLSGCEYLQAMLRMKDVMRGPSRTIEGDSNNVDLDSELDTREELVINDLSLHVLYLLLNELYFGPSIEIPSDALVETLIMAEKYGIESAKRRAEYEMIKNIDLDNVIDIFQLADLHNSAYLRDFCLKKIITNYQQIPKLAFSTKPIGARYGWTDLTAQSKNVSTSPTEEEEQSSQAIGEIASKELRRELIETLKQVEKKRELMLEKYDDINELHFKAVNYEPDLSKATRKQLKVATVSTAVVVAVGAIWFALLPDAALL